MVICPIAWIASLSSTLYGAEEIEEGSAEVLAHLSGVASMCGLVFVVFVKKGMADWWNVVGRLIWPVVGAVTALGLIVAVLSYRKDWVEWDELEEQERYRVPDGRAERRQARKALGRKEEDLEKAVVGEALIQLLLEYMIFKVGGLSQ
jgi:hypothetical protein